MAKHALIIEDDYSFDLFGICCPFKDYRVCWMLNQQLGISFKKSKESYMVSGKKGEILSSHSLYEFFDENHEVTYYLIQNKNEGKYLLPEFVEVDYLLIIKEDGIIDSEGVITEINKINEIVTIFKIDIERVKNKKRLIF